MTNDHTTSVGMSVSSLSSISFSGENASSSTSLLSSPAEHLAEISSYRVGWSEGVHGNPRGPLVMSCLQTKVIAGTTKATSSYVRLDHARCSVFSWSGLADKDFLWKFRHFAIIIYIKIWGYCSCLNGFRHSFVGGCSGTVRHVRHCFPRCLETPDINFF